MGFPIVACAICHQGVSKRSTVLLDPLTGGEGRACRTHPEVSRALDDKDMIRMLKFAESNQAWEEEIKMVALALRTLNLIFGLSMDRATVRMRAMLGVPEAVLFKARKRVEAMSPEPSPEEEMSLVLAAAALVSFEVV